MALKDRLKPEPGADDNGFTCPKYTPKLGSKRCIHYQDGGTCVLPDEFLCIEWQKAKEISCEDAAFLTAVCAAFPGATVSSFDKKKSTPTKEDKS